jgi:hypothetical protein
LRERNTGIEDLFQDGNESLFKLWQKNRDIINGMFIVADDRIKFIKHRPQVIDGG